MPRRRRVPKVRIGPMTPEQRDHLETAVFLFGPHHLTDAEREAAEHEGLIPEREE